MRYVGGTKIPFAQRFSVHQAALRSATAPRLLQAAHDLYGMAALEFTVLETVAPEDVAQREQEAIAELKPELNLHGFSDNTRFRLARGKSGEAFSIMFRGRKRTLAQIASETGLSHQTLRSRVKRGLHGEDLAAPLHRARRTPRGARAPEDYV